MNKFGILMDLPEGKLPGYYAQVVKALAGNVRLFDRDKELLIADTPEQRELVAEVMNRFGIPFEPIGLLLIPAEQLPPAAEDFGFVSKSGNCYLYAHLVAAFALVPASSDRGGGSPAEAGETDRAYEPGQALEQLAEHTLAAYADERRSYYVIERHLIPLAEGIAAAYGCRADFVASNEHGR